MPLLASTQSPLWGFYFELNFLGWAERVAGLQGRFSRLRVRRLGGDPGRRSKGAGENGAWQVAAPLGQPRPALLLG
jgi:hypothetical protein